MSAHKKRLQQHHALMVTPRQAERMKSGVRESKPSDYAFLGTDDSRRILDAIHNNEDRRAMKTLQEWW